MIPCSMYDVGCYASKPTQIFSHALRTQQHTQYFFYVEADNELCVPVSQLEEIAHKHKSYSICRSRCEWVDNVQTIYDGLP